MKRHRILFDIGFVVISLLFVASAIMLIGIAVQDLWSSLRPPADDSSFLRFNAVLNSISSLTVATAVLALGETILEEEVLRKGRMSTPTRLRRFLSRFMVVVIVSLSVEALVAVLQFVHEAPERLVEASVVGLAAAALLTAWGVFVRLNRGTETLDSGEPETDHQPEDEVEEQPA